MISFELFRTSENCLDKRKLKYKVKQKCYQSYDVMYLNIL